MDTMKANDLIQEELSSIREKLGTDCGFIGLIISTCNSEYQLVTNIGDVEICAGVLGAIAKNEKEVAEKNKKQG